MSQENVEIVRRATENLSQSGDPLWELLDPEIEWIIDPTGLLAGTYRGHDGVRTFLALLRESFVESHVEIDDLIDAGDTVVVLCRAQNRGRGSDMTVEQPLAFVNQVRGRRIVRTHVYFRQAEALEAVGLSE
jgi:ketosteroid isomerase-like protein